MNRLSRNILLLIVLLMNLGCDQISKEIARSSLEYHRPVAVIGDFFSLIKIENTGAFLSMGHNWPEWLRLLILHIMPVGFLVAGVYILLTNTRMSLLMASGLGFMLGGGTGNMIDRLTYGSVTDFLHLDLVLVETGIFNLADVSILIGVAFMVADQLLRRSHHIPA